MTVDPPDEPPASYRRDVGARLRGIRRQKRLSLQEVEAASNQEFKASVLGAYERGERAISVPRLQRLAQFYEVPVDQLLPEDRRGASAAPGSPRPSGGATITIDLRRLEGLDGKEAELLKQYLASIQVQRQDFNGRVLTVRHEDLRAIGCFLGVAVEEVILRLEEMGLRRGTGAIGAGPGSDG